MKDLLKRTGSLLVIAGSLFLFALACAESPMQPMEVEDNSQTSPVFVIAKQDTVPFPP